MQFLGVCKLLLFILIVVSILDPDFIKLAIGPIMQ
jgi:hypothetical protein